MNKSFDIAALIRKKIDGTITEHELLFLKKWAEENSLHSDLLKYTEAEDPVWEDVNTWLELRSHEHEDAWTKRLQSNTLSKIHTGDAQSSLPRRRGIRRILLYAAVLFLISTITFIIYQNYTSSEHIMEVQDLVPGTNKALITLSDGRVIELREDQTGVILGEDLAYEDGTLITDLDNKEPVYSTIATPRGGQYQITLSDGTKVWLNAETKLTYPSRFTGKARVVELDGEAYFDVASNSAHGHRIPFIVKTAQQEVEVLGTQFNVNAYADDSADTRTTLVEGSVRLRMAERMLLLQPGEQGVCNKQGLDKKKVDVSPYIAWKNNEFIFDETELGEALKMLSRWYDFDISAEGHLPTTHLYGSISRSKNLAEVLEIMESSGLKFKIERFENRNILKVLR
ncbi:FecR family protein [Sphingobacterium sp. SGG-5]|uniref:FecR family protein n=1 Tax=Sphingobacterium sp. SGG-5 TaxID=2710881 RepID=UPI0013E9AF5F|nr:FecR family protein [Sphingobacterium sp. SGG-5]NGM62382.1 FecR family protein [Sphingobacterium sp. SGG-5]